MKIDRIRKFSLLLLFPMTLPSVWAESEQRQAAPKAFVTPEAAQKELIASFNAEVTDQLFRLVGEDVVQCLLPEVATKPEYRKMQGQNLAKAQIDLWYKNEKKEWALLVSRGQPVFPVPLIKTTDGWVFKWAASEPKTAKERHSCLRCQANLAMIVKRSCMFADVPNSKGRFPKAIEELFPEYLETADSFVCPSVVQHAEGKGSLKKCDYIYVGGCEADGPNPQALLVAFERKGNHQTGRNVAFSDSHVEFIQDDAEFRSRLSQTLKASNISLDVPGKNDGQPPTEDQKARNAWVLMVRSELGLDQSGEKKP